MNTTIFFYSFLLAILPCKFIYFLCEFEDDMVDDNVKADSKNRNKYLQLLLKITITIACLWYISKKIDFKQLSETLFHAKWSMLAYGVLLYMTSKVFASVRL